MRQNRLANARTGEDKRTFYLRFSDAEKIAMMHGVWRQRASVTNTEIKFTESSAIWRINRRSGAATLEYLNGGLLGSGQCEEASAGKRF